MKPLSQQGSKDDSNKLRYDLLPYDALEEVIKIFMFGAARRGERNWEKGIAYSRIFSAAQRHLSCWFQKREQLDSESHLPHLAHAACNILFLLAYELRQIPGLDDRPETSTPISERMEGNSLAESISASPLPSSLLEQNPLLHSLLHFESDDEFPDAPRY